MKPKLDIKAEKTWKTFHSNMKLLDGIPDFMYSVFEV